MAKEDYKLKIYIDFGNWLYFITGFGSDLSLHQSNFSYFVEMFC